MTIDGMIAELQRRREMHGGQTVVQTTWEGVYREIELENIYFEKASRIVGQGPLGPVLWIDADFNSYRSKDAI